FLRENVDMATEVEKKIKEKLGVPSGDDSPSEEEKTTKTAKEPAKGPAKTPTRRSTSKSSKAPTTDVWSGRLAACPGRAGRPAQEGPSRGEGPGAVAASVDPFLTDPHQKRAG